MDDILGQLTENQLDTLLFIDQYRRVTGGWSPSLGDIGREHSISRVAALRRVRILERLGLVNRVPRSPRAISMTSMGRSVVASVAAGT